MTQTSALLEILAALTECLLNEAWIITWYLPVALKVYPTSRPDMVVPSTSHWMLSFFESSLASDPVSMNLHGRCGSANLYREIHAYSWPIGLRVSSV